MKGFVTVLAILVVVGLAFFLYRTPAAPPEMTEAETAAIQADVLVAAEAWMDSWKDVETDCETAVDSWHPEHMAFYSGGIRVDRAGWTDYCNRTTAIRASWDGSWTNPRSESSPRMLPCSSAHSSKRFPTTTILPPATIRRPAR
jgi:hypothetical protein